MNKRDSVCIEIPGKHYLHIEPDYLPPIGTKVQLHKHLYDGGTTLLLEVVDHEWRLDDDNIDESGEPKTPSFDITIRTKIVAP